MFIIGCYMAFVEARTYVLKIVLILGVCNGLSSLVYFSFVGDYHDNLCTVQGFLLVYLTLCSLLWSCVVLHTLQRALLTSLIGGSSRSFVSPEQQPELHWQTHLFCWSFPLLWSIIPLILDSYGKSSILTCHIRKEEHTLRFLVYLLPIWIIFVYVAVVTVKTRAHVTEHQTSMRQISEQSFSLRSTNFNVNDGMFDFVKRIHYYPASMRVSQTPFSS